MKEKRSNVTTKSKDRIPGLSRLLDCPGYLNQALVTNLSPSVPPLELWRPSAPGAGREEVIQRSALHG